MASKITKQDVRGCLSPPGLPRDCHKLTLYYQYYSKQEMVRRCDFFRERRYYLGK